MSIVSTSSIQATVIQNIKTIPGCISLLQSFARQSSISKGKEIHSWMLRHNLLTSPLSITSLINMYTKCNHMSYAMSVFGTLGNFRNVYAYNAIIAGFVGNNLYDQGFKLYLDMRYQGVSPDKFTFPSAIKGCSDIVEMRKIHSLLFKCGLDLDEFIASALVNCYLKLKAVNDAYKVLHDLPVSDVGNFRNVSAYNAIIAGFVGNNRYDKGFKLYLDMRYQGVSPDKFTFSSVIKCCPKVVEMRKIHALLFKSGLDLDEFIASAFVNCYLKFKAMNDAYKVFHDLPARDVVLCNAMINGSVHIGESRMALEIFRLMNKGEATPNNVTIIGSLSALSMSGDIDNGYTMHGFVIKKGYESVLEISNALIDMYCKCKHFDDAIRVFCSMAVKDISSWNTLLGVLQQSGDYHGTMELFRKMLDAGVIPDLVAVNTVLPACPPLTALLHVKEIHKYMIANGMGICRNTDDFENLFASNTLLDAYVKCGSMAYACRLYNTMTVKDAASWNIMIMGYGMHGHDNEALSMFDFMCADQITPPDDEVNLDYGSISGP